MPVLRTLYLYPFLYILPGWQVTLRWWEEMADDADSRDTAPLIRRAKFTPARAVAVVGVGFVGLLGLLALAHPPTAVEASSSPPFARMSNVSAGCTLPTTGTIDIYIGNGCFWCLAAPTSPGRGTNSLALTHLHSPTRKPLAGNGSGRTSTWRRQPPSPAREQTSPASSATRVARPSAPRFAALWDGAATTSSLLSTLRQLPTSYHFPPPTSPHELPLSHVLRPAAGLLPHGRQPRLFSTRACGGSACDAGRGTKRRWNPPALGPM